MPEFFALLNALPNAALIVDRKKLVIQICNAAFQRLTGFSQGELIAASLQTYLPDYLPTAAALGEEQYTRVNRRGRKGLEVSITATALDMQEQWLLLVLTATNATSLDLSGRERVLRGMRQLAHLTDEPDLSSALLKAVEICRQVLNAEYVALYQADPQQPQLKRTVCVGADQVLPDAMPSSDLIRLSSANIWVPGRRVQTELHRFARIGGLSYLASTPLGPGHALTGLLVAGGQDGEHMPQLDDIMEMCGLQIGLVTQYFLLVENLRKDLSQQDGILATNAAVFENTQEGVIVLDPNLTIREINSAAEWILGYANWEVQGQLVDNILIGPERLIPALEAACNGIPTHNIGNIYLHRRNGQSFPAHMQTIPVQKDGNFLGVIIILSDVSVTEQIRLRTQQLEHRAILGDVTAVFAHEVRNPINNISTGLQLVAMRLLPDDPNLETINRMENDCARLNHLMESVLAFSRPIEPKFEAVDIGILLRRMLDRWRPRMLRVNVEPFFQCAENTPRISADPRSLEQVFTNLISNAVEAMTGSGGTLAVKIAPSDTITTPPQVEIIVSDNGPGISDELRDRIFEPFITSKSSGTGLGLAITKRIVTAHHGSIGVDSFPGGTMFKVLLPAVKGE